MAVIEQVVAREILDSRGNPTVEVRGMFGRMVQLQLLQFHLVHLQVCSKL